MGFYIERNVNFVQTILLCAFNLKTSYFFIMKFDKNPILIDKRMNICLFICCQMELIATKNVVLTSVVAIYFRHIASHSTFKNEKLF